MARFGLHESRIPLTDIAESKQVDWPLWNGIGIRVSFNKSLGLVGSDKGVVELALQPEKKVSFLGINCEKLAVSLEDPEGFLSALAGSQKLESTQPVESTETIEG